MIGPDRTRTAKALVGLNAGSSWTRAERRATVPDVPLFKRKLPIPEPEPTPPMPSEVRAAWDRYSDAHEGERRAIIGHVAAWEATLTPGQRSQLRAEVVSELMSQAGSEVGRVWEEVGIVEGLDKGITSLTLMYEAAAEKLERRPLREVVWEVPVREHYEAIVAIRGSLIEGARREHYQSEG